MVCMDRQTLQLSFIIPTKFPGKKTRISKIVGWSSFNTDRTFGYKRILLKTLVHVEFLQCPQICDRISAPYYVLGYDIRAKIGLEILAKLTISIHFSA